MIRFSIDSMTIAFGSYRVLSGLQIEAEQGDIICILGRNGAGKTTLYRSILGLYREARGTMRIDTAYIPRRKRLRHFGYLPQRSFLPFDYSVRKGIALVLGKRDAGLCESNEVARGFLDKKCGYLSAGELRYIECLVVLSMNRSILLLDEPFSQVDPILCETLRQKIREASCGRIILMSDHLYRNILGIATHMKILKGGILHSVENNNESLMKHGYLPAM
jgi:lipopolysaccharide export system ATP-binding protein